MRKRESVSRTNLRFEQLEGRRLLAADFASCASVGFEPVEPSHCQVGAAEFPVELDIQIEDAIGGDSVADPAAELVVDPIASQPQQLDLSDGMDGYFGAISADSPSSALEFSTSADGTATIVMASTFEDSHVSMTITDSSGQNVELETTQDGPLATSTFDAVAGETYQLTVESLQPECNGEFQVTVGFEEYVDQHADAIGNESTELVWNDGQTELEGRLETAGDTDTFRFVAEADGEVVLQLNELVEGRRVDLDIQVLDSQSNLIVDGATNEMLQISFDVSQGQEYFLSLTAGEGQQGDYRIALELDAIAVQPQVPDPADAGVWIDQGNLADTLTGDQQSDELVVEDTAVDIDQSVEPVIEDLAQDNTLPEPEIADSAIESPAAVVSEDPGTDDLCSQNGSSEVLGDEVLGDEVLGDEVLGDEVLGDEVLGDEVLGDEVLGDEDPNSETLADIGSPEDTGILLEDPVSGDVSNCETVAEVSDSVLDDSPATGDEAPQLEVVADIQVPQSETEDELVGSTEVQADIPNDQPNEIVEAPIGDGILIPELSEVPTQSVELNPEPETELAEQPGLELVGDTVENQVDEETDQPIVCYFGNESVDELFAELGSLDPSTGVNDGSQFGTFNAFGGNFNFWANGSRSSIRRG